MEGHGAVTAVSALHVDVNLVDEFHEPLNRKCKQALEPMKLGARSTEEVLPQLLAAAAG
jgi:hypothetical protein